VLQPVGDRLSYDLVFDVQGTLIKVQVKVAWEIKPGIYCCDTRRTKTNRRQMLRDKYQDSDFDFAIIIADTHCYVMPSKVFNSYKSSVTLSPGKDGRAKSGPYLEAWNLIS
jgi:hypothetical protein